MRRFAIALALVLPVTLPAAAYAHAHLDHAMPPAGSSQATAPREVVLSFTQDLEPAFSTIEVRNDAGAVVSNGKAQLDDKQHTQLRVPLNALGPGTYKVIWHVLSVDTHRTQGDFTFRVGP
jgi:methionine-rich copper-binding protein CopC